MTAVGLIAGLLLGAIATRVYDRRGYHRIPGAAEQAHADAPVMEESPSGQK
jgi:hypothetical protein